MANLVTQVLEPTIGNYFRNAAQNSDVIDFLKQRSKRQNEAKESISTAAPAKAMADTQPQVVTAERSVQMAKTRNAEADAMVLRTVGAAEEARTAARCSTSCSPR